MQKDNREKEFNRALFKQVLDDNVGNKYDPSLLYASAWGSDGLVKCLLDAGANNSNAALISASSGGWPGVVEILLDRGADSLNEALKMTTCSYAYDQYRKDTDCAMMANILIDRGANNFDEALISVASKFYRPGRFGIIEFLIEKGAKNLNAALESSLVSPYQVTLGVVKLLLEKGEDNLNQALELASERGRKDIAKLLLDREDTAKFLRSRRDGEDEIECKDELMDEYGMFPESEIYGYESQHHESLEMNTIPLAFFWSYRLFLMVFGPIF
ncbi:hypothetical protein K440DRAFT_664745 [Wilcoxina mikolae CBS 423.85]|nr:hypothetical protein K440DRAFT_664745 [Wilcoxina mikolae CBS 423.85]